MNRLQTALPVLVMLAACGGGGGGGTPSLDPSPSLTSVTFLGSGAAPAAGDKLRLLFSEPVTLEPSAILDATDLAVASGTLGAVGAAPTAVSPHLIEITLGSGVSMTVGTSTFALLAANDVVKDASGQLATPSAAVPLKKADAETPAISGLTLNDIDSVLNGTGAAGGTLQVAETGFTIDLAYADTTSAVDPGLTIVSSNVNVNVGGSNLLAGQNLLSHLTTTSATGTAAKLTVPAAVVFPAGAVTLTSYVADTTGRLSAAVTFSFRVINRNEQLRLFETNSNPSQVWFLDLSRDIESMSVNLSNGTTPVEVSTGANSRSDFEDTLQVLGLRAASPAANVIGTKNSNEVVLDQFKAKVLAELGILYNGINVTFTFTAPGTFPPNTQVVPYNNFSFSQMCIAGAATSTGNTGVLGLAIFDPHNEVHENDCLTDFEGDRLGVFLHTLVNNGYLAGPLTQFAVTFNPFAPVKVGGGTGVPIGTHPDGLDPDRLRGTNTDTRAGDITRAINDLARFIAVVAAHECGHSLGLVENGAMPTGLYGGDITNFPGSSAGHLVMPTSIFPGNSFNVMSPSVGYVGSLDSGTKFNTLNQAYLEEVAIYN